MGSNGWRYRAGPRGLELYQRDSGLHVLVDEVRVPREQWAQAPRHVSMALTNRCALRCRHCVVAKGNEQLELEQVKKWVRELEQGGSLSVGWGGGEPTLYDGLVELCRWVTEQTSLAVSLTTNGLEWDRRLSEGLRGHVHLVRVSIDGVGGTYERMRGRKFAELLRGLEWVRETSRFGVNMVISEQTVEEVGQVAELTEQWGGKELLLIPQVGPGGQVRCEGETLERVRRWIESYQGRLRLRISERGWWKVGCEGWEQEPGVMGYAHVDVNGTVKRDSYAEQGVRIGEGGLVAAVRRLKQQEEKRDESMA